VSCFIPKIIVLGGFEMSNAMANAIPPSQVSIVNGQRVYQSNHGAGIVNDSGQDLAYLLDAVLTDSVGNQQALPTQSLVASGVGSQSSSSPIFMLQLDAALYTSGQAVTFTASTTVSGGVTAFAQQAFTLTIT
jgi:hypothetical protein